MKDTGYRFMQDTKYLNITPSAQNRGEPQPPLQLPIPPNAKTIALPAPQTLELPGGDLQ